VKLLVEEYGVPPACRIEGGAQPLHVAAGAGQLEVLKYLVLECGDRKSDKKDGGGDEGEEEGAGTACPCNLLLGHVHGHGHGHGHGHSGDAGGGNGSGSGSEGEEDGHGLVAATEGNNAAAGTAAAAAAVAASSSPSAHSTSSSTSSLAAAAAAAAAAASTPHPPPAGAADGAAAGADGDDDAAAAAAAAAAATAATTLRRLFTVDVDARTNDGRTAIHFALKGAHEACALFLAREGRCRVDVADAGGRSPLMWACCLGLLPVARCLVAERGADPRTVDVEGYDVASIAATGGSVEAVRFLVVEAGLGMGSIDDPGHNRAGARLLYIAARYGHLPLVKWLVEAGGAAVDARSTEAGVRCGGCCGCACGCGCVWMWMGGGVFG
jgi:hypothetical protein